VPSLHKLDFQVLHARSMQSRCLRWARGRTKALCPAPLQKASCWPTARAPARGGTTAQSQWTEGGTPDMALNIDMRIPSDGHSGPAVMGLPPNGAVMDLQLV